MISAEFAAQGMAKLLTAFTCDSGSRGKFGKGIFIDHSAILSSPGGIGFEDGVTAAPGVRTATINYDMYDRHTAYTYGKVLVKKNAWLGMGCTICPGVTVGKYAVAAAGADSAGVQLRYTKVCQ